MSIITIDNLLKKSIFDNYLNQICNDTRQKSLWINAKEFQQSQQDLRFMPLSKILLKSGELRSILGDEKDKYYYYELYQDHLIKYNNEMEKQEITIIYLVDTMMQFLDNESCFLLTHCQQFDIVQSLNEELYQGWKNAFKTCCILSNFKQYYVISEELGRGNFGVVKKCINYENKQEFAVKIMNKQYLQEAKDIAFFLNEIAIMRQIKHEFIVSLYEVYEDQENVYLVMELLKGFSLKDYKKYNTGQLKIDFIYQIFSQLLLALKYLNEKGIMHRDIKFENIVFKNEQNDQIKIIDFGLSEYCYKKQLFFTRPGTPGYVAPEILNNNKPNIKSDLFSAGALLFEMLTNEQLFKSSNQQQIVNENTFCNIN